MWTETSGVEYEALALVSNTFACFQLHLGYLSTFKLMIVIKREKVMVVGVWPILSFSEFFFFFFFSSNRSSWSGYTQFDELFPLMQCTRLFFLPPDWGSSVGETSSSFSSIALPPSSLHRQLSSLWFSFICSTDWSSSRLVYKQASLQVPMDWQHKFFIPVWFSVCSKTCLNGGKCYFSSGTQRCRCATQYTGEHCNSECVCMCQRNDILHWDNTPTLDSCFGLVGHHQQGAECEPLESKPLNIMANAEPLAVCVCVCVCVCACACACVYMSLPLSAVLV